MIERWVIKEHTVVDTVDDKEFWSRDQAFVHIANVIYNELQEIKKNK